jgi:hypothetical protein
MDSTDIRFDGWTLRRDSGELSRDGATQRLPPQPLGMLLALLDNAGQVVTRESLVRVLWPRGIVDFDNSLNAVVRKLRVALGDDPEAPRYMMTRKRPATSRPSPASVTAFWEKSSARSWVQGRRRRQCRYRRNAAGSRR